MSARTGAGRMAGLGDGRVAGVRAGVGVGRAAGALAVVVAAALLAACGGGSDDDGAGLGAEGGGASPGAGGGAGADLTVEARDIEFDRDAYRLAAGQVDIEYVQEGSLPHSLVIEAADGGSVDGFKLEVGGADTDSGTVDLPAGDYTIYCDVPGHREAGMEAALEVG